MIGRDTQALPDRKGQLPLRLSYVAPRHSSTLPKRSPAACAMDPAASLGLGFWPSSQYVVLQLRGKTGTPPCIRPIRGARVRTL